VHPWASVAVTVKKNVPTLAGIPERIPPEARVSPAGTEPAVTANVYGAVPPIAVSG
jgi:hypothetical protein